MTVSPPPPDLVALDERPAEPEPVDLRFARLEPERWIGTERACEIGASPEPMGHGPGGVLRARTECVTRAAATPVILERSHDSPALGAGALALVRVLEVPAAATAPLVVALVRELEGRYRIPYLPRCGTCPGDAPLLSEMRRAEPGDDLAAEPGASEGRCRVVSTGVLAWDEAREHVRVPTVCRHAGGDVDTVLLVPAARLEDTSALVPGVVARVARAGDAWALTAVLADHWGFPARWPLERAVPREPLDGLVE